MSALHPDESSGDEVETPDDLFEVLYNEFHFCIDVCAKSENRKLGSYWGPDRFPTTVRDALAFQWPSQYEALNSFWMNPPYSRDLISKFMEKACRESREGATIVCLVRDDPSAKWYQNYVDGCAKEVRRLKRRVKFKGQKSCYPFPCCIVIYTPEEVTETKYVLWDWKE